MAEPAPDATTVSTCVADSGFAFSLAWVAPLRADALQLHTCAFAPMDATGDRLPWIVTVDVRDRGGGAPEPLDIEGATTVERGELDVLGTRVPWIAIDDETPWTGPGRMLLAQVSLQEHDVVLAFIAATGTTAQLRARLRTALGTLTVHAAVPRDGLVLDPTRSVCGGDAGQPLLTLVIPAGARADDSLPGVCVAFAGQDVESPTWLLTVHVVAPDEPGARALEAEPDGALGYLANDVGTVEPFDRGVVRWLGSDARWYAIDRTLDGVPRLIVASRVRVGTSLVLALANIAPSERARIPAVLAALGGVRRVE